MASGTKPFKEPVVQGSEVLIAPPRPAVEPADRTGRNTSGWRSWAELRERIGDQLHTDDGGITYYRLVKRHTGRSRLVDGKLKYEVYLEKRPVALTPQEARVARDFDGRRTCADYWDGVCWWRNGLKPEQEYPENRGLVLAEEPLLEDAPPGDEVARLSQAPRLVAVIPGGN